MTKSELAERLVTRMEQLTLRDAEQAVKIIFDAMSVSLSKGHRIEIRGFGSFTVTHRRSRVGRNPRSGESVSVPAKRVPHFKPGKILRTAVEAIAPDQAPGSPSDTNAPPLKASTS